MLPFSVDPETDHSLLRGTNLKHSDEGGKSQASKMLTPLFNGHIGASTMQNRLQFL